MENKQLEINFNEERWEAIKGYEGLYEVSSYGNVRSLDREKKNKSNSISLIKGRVLKPKTDFGYYRVGLSKNGKINYYRVNRLVAQAFIPNPNNLPQVNHINEIKTDNRVENLEWCTLIYNINYGTGIKRSAESKFKPILQFTLDGKFIKEYPSIKEAGKQLGIFHSNISAVCKGRLNQTGGYKWKYKEN